MVATAQHPQIEASDPELDAVFSALADPVRREILTMLDGNDLLVSEVAAPFDMSLQGVSKHIQILVRAGLITQERTGRVSLCRLDAGPIYEAALWLNRYSKYWQNQFETLAGWLDALENKKTDSAKKPSSKGNRRSKS